jgi:hypothetical protein
VLYLSAVSFFPVYLLNQQIRIDTTNTNKNQIILKLQGLSNIQGKLSNNNDSAIIKYQQLNGAKQK